MRLFWTARKDDKEERTQMLIKHRPMTFYGGLNSASGADIKDWKKREWDLEREGERRGEEGGGRRERGCEKERRELYSVAVACWVMGAGKN